MLGPAAGPGLFHVLLSKFFTGLFRLSPFPHAVSAVEASTSTTEAVGRALKS